MPTIVSSSKKVLYDIRLRKQIERRMILDTLGDLASLGFNVKNYTYLGFGSPFYVDFILVHKYLGIQNMICVEHDKSIEQRMKFNLPFRYVKLTMGEIVPEISRLSIDKKYIVWLDYDDVINDDHISDVTVASSNL